MEEVEIKPVRSKRIVRETTVALITNRIAGGRYVYQYGEVKVRIPPEWAGKKVRVIIEEIEEGGHD